MKLKLLFSSITTIIACTFYLVMIYFFDFCEGRTYFFFHFFIFYFIGLHVFSLFINDKTEDLLKEKENLTKEVEKLTKENEKKISENRLLKDKSDFFECHCNTLKTTNETIRKDLEISNRRELDVQIIAQKVAEEYYNEKFNELKEHADNYPKLLNAYQNALNTISTKKLEYDNLQQDIKEKDKKLNNTTRENIVLHKTADAFISELTELYPREEEGFFTKIYNRIKKDIRNSKPKQENI